MTTRFHDSPEFERLLKAESARSAAHRSRAGSRFPELEIAQYVSKVSQLADRVRDRCPAGSRNLGRSSDRSTGPFS